MQLFDSSAIHLADKMAANWLINLWLLVLIGTKLCFASSFAFIFYGCFVFLLLLSMERLDEFSSFHYSTLGYCFPLLYLVLFISPPLLQLLLRAYYTLYECPSLPQLEQCGLHPFTNTISFLSLISLRSPLMFEALSE